MMIINCDELKSRLDAGEEMNLLDVREPDERAEFNIGGTFLPLGNIQMMKT
jgi:rhodanese-related sulfurtransferase